MGDRCYLRMTIRKKDLPAFREILGWPEFGQVEENDAYWADKVFYEIEESEANYGWYDELNAAAKKDLMLFGYSAPGGSYGPSLFAVVDGHYFGVACDTDRGEPSVVVRWINKKAVPSRAELQYVAKYFAAKDKIEAAFKLRPASEPTIKQKELF